MTETWTTRVLVKLQWALTGFSYGITNYRHPMRTKSLEAVKKSLEGLYTATTPLECTEIYQVAAACRKVDGDMAEAGVYLGGTARLLLEALPEKRLHLFDTFEGLPHDEGRFEAGEWRGSLPVVRENLKDDLNRLEFHQGFFPDSAVGLEHLRFSFVHLDLDLYSSTIAALEWFWPRMNPGGVILSHDYPAAEGVLKAFHEFFDPRPEPIIPLSGIQCVVIKS